MLELVVNMSVGKEHKAALHALYEVSNKYSVKSGLVAGKKWTSINDGEDITVAFIFEDEASKDKFLKDSYVSRILPYIKVS